MTTFDPDKPVEFVVAEPEAAGEAVFDPTQPVEIVKADEPVEASVGNPLGLTGRGEFIPRMDPDAPKIGDKLKAYKKSQQFKRDQIAEALRGKGKYHAGETVEDFGLLFDLFRSDELSEMRKKVKDTYGPDADVLAVPVRGLEGDVETVNLIKLGDDFYELDPPKLLDKTLMAQIASGLGSFESAGALAGGAIVGGITKSPPSAIAGSAAGASLGRFIDEKLEESRGYQDTGVFGQAINVLFAGLTAGAGETIGTIALKGLPPLKLNKELVEVLKAIDQEGGQGLMAGQLLEKTWGKALFDFVSRNTPIRKARTRQEVDLLNRFKSMVDSGDLSGLSNQDLEKILLLQKQRLADIYMPPGVPEQDGIDALFEGIKAWEAGTRELVDRRYAAFNKIAAEKEDLFFNIQDARELASEILEGVKAERVPLRGPDGKFTKSPPVKVSDPLPRDVERLLEDIESLKPIISTTNLGSSVDKVRALRTRVLNAALDQKNPRIAEKLWRVHDSLVNAIDAGVADAPDVRAALQLANDTYKSFVETRKHSVIQRALREGAQPSEVVARFMRPGNVDQIGLLKEVVPEENWKTFQQAAAARIISRAMATADESKGSLGAGALKREIAAWEKVDHRARQMVFPDDVWNSIKAYQQELHKMEKTGVAKMLALELSEGERALDLISHAGSAPVRSQINSLIKETGGADGKVAVAMRTALYNRILERASTVKDDLLVIDPNKFVKEVENAHELFGDATFMRGHDWTRLRNFERWASALASPTEGIGGGMARGEAVSGLLKARNLAASRLYFLKTDLIARLLAQPITYNQLLRSNTIGSRQMNGITGALATTTAQVLADARRTPQEESKEPLTFKDLVPGMLK